MRRNSFFHFIKSDRTVLVLLLVPLIRLQDRALAKAPERPPVKVPDRALALVLLLAQA